MKCGFENEACARTFVRVSRETSGEIPFGNLRALRAHLVQEAGVTPRSLTNRQLLAGLQVVSRLVKYGMVLSQHNQHDVYFDAPEARVVVPCFLDHGLIKAERAFDSTGTKGKQYLCISFAS